jgi:hypothetical protein
MLCLRDKGNLAIVRVLVQVGAALDAASPTSSVINREAAMHTAAHQEKYHLGSDTRTHAGASLNLTDDHGNRALHYAAKGGHLAITRYDINKCHDAMMYPTLVFCAYDVFSWYVMFIY